LEVGGGEVFGYLGHNGAGKTTTVRLLNGILAPSSGTARVLGLSPEADGAGLRRRTGDLTETPALDDRLTARETLHFAGTMFGVEAPHLPSRVETLLEGFGLGERAGERVGGYSKGMRQRLALARALVHEPELLFLDEPTSGLDPAARRQVHQLVRRLSREEGRTVFLSTHNLAEAQELCDRVAVLQRGRVIAMGAPAELARRLGDRAALELEADPGDREAAIASLRAHGLAPAEEPAAGAVVVPGGEGREIPAIVSRIVAAGIPL